MKFVQASQVFQYNFEGFINTTHTNLQETMDYNIKNRNET